LDWTLRSRFFRLDAGGHDSVTLTGVRHAAKAPRGQQQSRQIDLAASECGSQHIHSNQQT